MASDCAQAACLFMLEEPSLLWEPVLSLVMKVVAIVAAGAGFLLLVCTAEVTHTPGHGAISRDFAFRPEEKAYL
eukprot:CAMPEP_0168704014 /NCGR_PEP_ID=MMETSP0503-20121227/39358_1 /TAXON_ID=89963 /ORGANISM="Heterocapsa rotundata, Strain SCCAP K-0483" /LENGTH=73 /DNA_ID=CAMNT_0008750211 /DNA_START=44 /DNA_END=262 /DNA_ORIENTATION=-